VVLPEASGPVSSRMVMVEDYEARVWMGDVGRARPRSVGGR
jgi:hypothetical protein